LEKNKNINKFIPWFLGFCDAECSFISNPVPRINKQNIITSYRIFYRIQIGLNIIDKPILEYINKNLNSIGKIYDYETRQESTLCFISLEKIKYLIENIFTDNPLLTNYQSNRFAKLKKGINENIGGVKTIEEYESIFLNIEEITPKFENCSQFYLDHWLIGFLNGEVSFTSFAKTGKKDVLKPKISLEHTDERALIFFKNHLELGPKVCQLKQRQNRKITHRIDITSVNDLNKICKFLDNRDCLIGNKLNQYSNWKSKFNLNL
jgi:LAGLIDADG endonuclease